MAELYLVRHGQASFGNDDYDRLSALGERQSIRLGQYFAAQGIRFDRVITGSLLRHRQTAAGIMAGMGIAHTREECTDLDEYDFHALYQAAIRQHPELESAAAGDRRAFYRGLKRVLHLWTKDEIEGPLPERWRDFHARIGRARRQFQEGRRGRILAISSGGVIATLTQQALEAPSAAAIELSLLLHNSSFSRYFFNAEAFSLGSFNNIPHLRPLEDAEMVTYS